MKQLIEDKTIYDLNLHESIRLPYDIIVIRVPGGWLWDSWDIERDCYKQGIFIPFDNEFQMIGKLLNCIKH